MYLCYSNYIYSIKVNFIAHVIARSSCIFTTSLIYLFNKDQFILMVSQDVYVSFYYYVYLFNR